MAKEINTPNTTELDDGKKKLIDDAVVFINEKANETVYKGYTEIGEYILENFFNNNIQEASSRNPKKNNSFNELCKREDLVMDPSNLSKMVRVASQERFLSDKKIDISSLSYTHRASLVKLDNSGKKIKLIKKCIENDWSTRTLDDEIKKVVKSLASKRDPSLIQTTQKYIRKVDNVLNNIDSSSLEIDREDLSKIPDGKIKNLQKKLKELKKKIENASEKSGNISSSCDDLLGKLTEIEKERKKNPPKRGRKPKAEK